MAIVDELKYVGWFIMFTLAKKLGVNARHMHVCCFQFFNSIYMPKAAILRNPAVSLWVF